MPGRNGAGRYLGNVLAWVAATRTTRGRGGVTHTGSRVGVVCGGFFPQECVNCDVRGERGGAGTRCASGGRVLGTADERPGGVVSERLRANS